MDKSTARAGTGFYLSGGGGDMLPVIAARLGENT